MADMDRKELESALEAILFASGEPVQVDRICVALDIDRPTVEQLLQKLMDYYAYERRGIRLLKIDDSWQLCSAPDYAETIRKAFEIRKPAKLSQPALEVLTIIAYYQPTTRAYVDQIRGVDSSYTVGLLLDRGLIEECGRLQVPGRPRQYRTTKQFLRAFHLSSLKELPELPDDIGEDGQMRLNEAGEVVDPMGDTEAPAQTDAGEPGKQKTAEKRKKTGRSAEKADAKAGEAEEGVPEAHAQRHSGRMEGPVAAAEKGAAPYPPGRADRSAGCVRYFRGTGGTCGRRAAIRRAARGRLDRDAGAGTTAGDPPAAYPPGC